MDRDDYTDSIFGQARRTVGELFRLDGARRTRLTLTARSVDATTMDEEAR